MADSDRSRFQRQQAADPQDEEARLRLLAERARVEGEGVYLECLSDRLLWNRSSAAVQDLAVLEVGRRLGKVFAHVETRDFECAGLSHRIATFEHLKSGALLNLLPGGRFMMGADEDENIDDHLRPVHEVVIRRPFLLGLFGVSQIVWDRLGGEDDRGCVGPDLPIDGVSWNAIQTWLKKAEGGLRLPSEAEWEYAGRAGSTTKYFWGDNVDGSFCWSFENSENTTHAMNEHATKTNSFGLVDMSGNVWEWCQDKDDVRGDYSSGPNNELPREPASVSMRVIRGGCWSNGAEDARSADRWYYSPGHQNNDLGFRVARAVD